MLSSDFHVKPKKFRLFFIVLLALLLGVIAASPEPATDRGSAGVGRRWSG